MVFPGIGPFVVFSQPHHPYRFAMLPGRNTAFYGRRCCKIHPASFMETLAYVVDLEVVRLGSCMVDFRSPDKVDKHDVWFC